LCIIVLAWVVFKAESIGHAMIIYPDLFRFAFYHSSVDNRKDALKAILVVLIFFLIEWAGREKQHPIAALEIKWRKPYRWILYYLIILVIIIFCR